MVESRETAHWHQQHHVLWEESVEPILSLRTSERENVYYLRVFLPLTWNIWKQRCQLVYRRLLLLKLHCQLQQAKTKMVVSFLVLLTQLLLVNAVLEISAKPNMPKTWAMMEEAIIMFSKAYNRDSVTDFPNSRFSICYASNSCMQKGEETISSRIIKTVKGQKWVDIWYCFILVFLFHVPAEWQHPR